MLISSAMMRFCSLVQRKVEFFDLYVGEIVGTGILIIDLGSMRLR